MPPNEVEGISRVISGTVLDVASVRELLTCKRLGSSFHYFAEVSSTNTRARELAGQGAAEGEIVIAESQTHGRGRLGRRWESPPGRNLYLSVILRPQLPPRLAPQITLTAAVALVETVAAFLTRPAVIKWPNDILVGGRKLAGILTEAACDAARVDYVVLGIGLNVNYRVESMPEELGSRATSLSHLNGKDVSRESVLARLIQDLDRCYGELEENGFESLRPRWEAHFGSRGRLVRVEIGGVTLTGRALGIDREGALLVLDEHGECRTIFAGEVIALES
jgi:BirA family transcriptional regulator, biotin operon repressor / biotin---[acetyl-CoA-carboxylase] ligase